MKPASSRLNLILKTLFVAFSLAIFIAWLQYTPAGVLGKMDAVGYAVCHRIDLRSFHMGDRALPLCARCSGMHLAALLGIAFQALSGRKGKMPPLKIFLVLGFFALAFAVDGINSYLHFFPAFTWGYQPQNWLRLLTGTGLGLGIAAVLYPVFNQTIWQNWVDLPALGSWKDLAELVGLAALLDLALLSENAIVLFPLAILSGVAVLLILAVCYTLLLILLFKKENQFLTWRSLWVPLLAGFTIALLQTYLVDILRFTFTGTWAGFTL